MISDDLHAEVLAWMADDPDERDRAELAALLREASQPDAQETTGQAAAELAGRFAGRLDFGTAGLRGKIGAGPNRMNRAVVRGTTAALAGWLLYVDPRAAEAGVVIGCDARHRSDEFTTEAAAVLAGAGIRVHLLPQRQPTPLLAYAVTHLAAAAGIMITASHNPSSDNGYKLYLSDGAQIVPPADLEIEAAISAFDQAGFPPPDVVEAQAQPDPDFRTVAFPNPEEPGSLDLALAQARRSGADLVLANDPDGDRLAVAVPDDTAPGGWRTLTGDQLGSLLGAYLLSLEAARPSGAHAAPVAFSESLAAGGATTPGRQQPLVATTIVSATMLATIASAAGADYVETLTGFKWIARAGDLRPVSRFIFGYEEALGYTIGTTVRDKDGIGAALAVLSLAARARSGGESLLEAYDALEVAHGVHLTEQLTVQTTTPVQVMSRLRVAAPTELADQPIIAMSDLTGGTADLPSADVLRYKLRGARVLIRPSGIEPKIKAYLEVVEPVIAGRLTEARRAARARMNPLREAVSGLLGG